MKLFLVAGEASGDKLGAALMRGLKQLAPEVEFHGIGGELMQAEGLESLFEMSRLSVMGLAEVLPKLRELFALRDKAAEAIQGLQPDALITIDSPGFCLRLAKVVKARAPDLPVIHYVAPSVWAWRPGRAKKMAAHVDHVLALLPFEPPLMQAAGMSCDFVGHPVVAEPLASPDEARAFREAHNIAPDAPLLLTLPGSRLSEISRLAPVFGATLARLAPDFPGLTPVLPTLPHLVPQIRELTESWPIHPILPDPGDEAQKAAAFAAADAALAASGTVSLELAAANTPMVIAYRMKWLSHQIISRLMLIDTVTLVNLIDDSRHIPEFLGPRCRSELIAPALAELLRDPEKRAPQIRAMQATMQALGQGSEDPGLRAAHSVLARLGRG